jgi:radical SAM protein with 4Fe4S-binding SPASM domain
MKSKLYEAIFLDEKIGPEKVMISPTDHCNLVCKICWRHAKHGKYGELGLREIKKVLKDCKELGVKIIDLTGGGEAFFRKDIFDILRLVKSYDFYGTLTTNGTLLSRERIEKLVKMKWDDISFSLDSHDSRINDCIRGDGVFQKVINAINDFEKIKKRFNTDFPFLRITTVINKLNYMSLDGIIELANSLGIEAINFSTLVEFKTNKEFWMRRVNKRELTKSLEKAFKKSKKMKIHTNLKSIIKFGVLNHKKPKFCFAPWLMAFINASGKVMVCCTLASLYSNIVGDINNSSFKDIWLGEKMEKFRKRVKEKKLPKECEKCIPEFVDIFNEYYDGMKCRLKK